MSNKMINPIDQCQLKFVNETKGEFEGYASVFNGNDAVNDTVLPGAYKNTLANDPPAKMYANHDHRMGALPIGKWVNMTEDSHGLLVTGQLFMETEKGRHAFVAMKEGVTSGLSIGYSVGKYEQKSNGGRNLIEIGLKEVSIVDYPCDTSALITSVKAEELTTLKDFELLMRDAGQSKSMATALISQFKGIARCENEAEYLRQIAELKAHIGRLNAELLIRRIK